MLAFDGRVFKMHLPVELDPDFGNIQPDKGQGFVVTVFKKNKDGIRKRRFKFLLLIPDIDISDGDLMCILEGVTEIFLEKKEEYKIRDLTDEDVGEYTKDTPVLSFHPKSIYDEKIGFFWQKPPHHLTH